MMKKCAAAILCLGALALTACAEGSSIAPAQSEITSTVTETTLTSTAVETTVTVTEPAPLPLDDYTIAEGLALEAVEESVRDSRCTLRLTNTGSSDAAYLLEYRLIDAATGQPLEVFDFMDTVSDKVQKIAPGETKEIEADWSNRYSSLKGGDYEYELLIAEDDGNGKRLVCRAPFTVVESVFTPTLTVLPETVRPSGLTLQVQNSDDAARTYGLAYRIYEKESGTLMLRVADMQAMKNKNYYVKPGETLLLGMDWKESFGSLLSGAYRIEIELQEDGAEAAKTYSTEFEIG